VGIKFSEILSNAGTLFLLTAVAALSVFLTRNYFILTAIFLVYFGLHLWISFPELKQILTMIKNRKEATA
jgi:hypothetical protein